MSEMRLYFCEAWGPTDDEVLYFPFVAANSEEADRRAEDYIGKQGFIAVSKDVYRVDELDGYKVILEPLPKPKEPPSWVSQPELPFEDLAGRA